MPLSITTVENSLISKDIIIYKYKSLISLVFKRGFGVLGFWIGFGLVFGLVVDWFWIVFWIGFGLVFGLVLDWFGIGVLD